MVIVVGVVALRADPTHCLDLTTADVLTVIVSYQPYEARVERYTPYLPLVSATVLVGMGLGFVVGVF